MSQPNEKGPVQYGRTGTGYTGPLINNGNQGAPSTPQGLPPQGGSGTAPPQNKGGSSPTNQKK